VAYDEELADRIRDVSQGEPGLSEKRMFGGLAFLVGGNMAVAASSKRDMMVRIDPSRAEELLARDHVSRMEMGGKLMDGWLRVATPALETDDALAEWVEVGLDYARTLPPK
jgi:TfoX/Sxy family transcriptional regulator of competence genes